MMQHIYSKPLNQLTEEEWKKVEEFRSKKKPLIAFSTATLYDCGRSDGLALDFDNVTMLNNRIPSLRIPDSFASPIPSDFLCETLHNFENVWVLNNENSARIVINAILTQVLLNQVNEKLSGYYDVKNDWDGPGFEHIGNADYMFGFSRLNSVESMESLFFIIQARNEWPDQAVAKVICEAGCLLRSRQAAGKNTPVFAALTNGNLFRFFAIDTDGIVYASELIILQLDMMVLTNQVLLCLKFYVGSCGL